MNIDSFANASLTVEKQPTTVLMYYMPLIGLAIYIVGASILIKIVTALYNNFIAAREQSHTQEDAPFDHSFLRLKGDKSQNSFRPSSAFSSSSNTEGADIVEAKAKKASSRLSSLDSFRGFSLCIMIFANEGGAGYWFLDHSAWNGLTVADLVFPWFIWMMGFSAAISFASLRRKNAPFSFVMWKSMKRALILYCLGVFVSNGAGNTWDSLRIMGVLQRFGVTYFFLSWIVVPSLWSKEDEEENVARGGYEEEHIRHYFSDVTENWIEFIVVGVFILVWTCLTFLLDVPGCGKGYLGPGGLLGDQGKYVGCTGGAAGYIDTLIMGVNHEYGGPTPKDIYGTGSYDPEGLLGCLTSLVITYLGYHAGRVIVYYKDEESKHNDRMQRWILQFIVYGLIGGVLCGFEQNGGWIPVNKNLWSLSFVFVLSAGGCFMITVFYYIIDVIGLWEGTPFIFPGMNSIVIYVLSEFLCGTQFPFAWSPTSAVTDHVFPTFINTWGLTMMILIAYVLYRKKVFISI
jgi:heparan-alpha-glucosaminide N-acetyltransferase